jgi:hypothetical protein
MGKHFMSSSVPARVRVYDVRTIIDSINLSILLTGAVLVVVVNG